MCRVPTGAAARVVRLILAASVACACEREDAALDASLALPEPGDRAAARPHHEAATAAFGRGDLVAAIGAVEQALALDPAFVEARVLRAASRSRPGPHFDPTLAAADLALARRLGADPATLVGLEGLVRFQLGENDAARRLLEEAFARPSSADDAGSRADYAVALGEIARREGDLEAAQRWLERGHELAPRHPIPCEALARIAGERGDSAQEERWLAAAIAADPRSVAARAARVKLYARTGRGAQAQLEREIHELVRQLADDESRAFARDHRRRADVWQRYVELVPEDAAARLEAVRERTRAGEIAAARALAQRYAALPGSAAAEWEPVLRDLERMEKAGGAPRTPRKDGS